MLGTVILPSIFLKGNLGDKADDKEGLAVDKPYVVSQAKGTAEI